MILFYLLPLLAGLLFALAAVFTKRAIDSGLGPWRMTVVNSWVFLVVFLPLLLVEGVPWSAIPWYQPLALSVLITAGNLLMFLAFSRGDVSVAAPILGTKVVLVAVFTVTILGQPVAPSLWVAAVLATLGIAFLRAPGLPRSGANLPLTILYAILSAMCFALSDVLVQRWITPESFTRFLPAMYLLAGLWSLVLVRFFRESVLAIPGRVWGYLLPGGALMALQALVFVYGLSRFGRATAFNVLYNTRGLWSVLIIWMVGHWFASEEASVGHRVMAARFVGALLLVAAVVLVMN